MSLINPPFFSKCFLVLPVKWFNTVLNLTSGVGLYGKKGDHNKNCNKDPTDIFVKRLLMEKRVFLVEGNMCALPLSITEPS